MIDSQPEAFIVPLFFLFISSFCFCAFSLLFFSTYILRIMCNTYTITCIHVTNTLTARENQFFQFFIFFSLLMNSRWQIFSHVTFRAFGGNFAKLARKHWGNLRRTWASRIAPLSFLNDFSFSFWKLWFLCSSLDEFRVMKTITKLSSQALHKSFTINDCIDVTCRTIKTFSQDRIGGYEFQRKIHESPQITDNPILSAVVNC